MKKPTSQELKKEADKEIYPKSEDDLSGYSKWSAGVKHYDHSNKVQYNNRFLLSSPPQSGKTGVFLQLGLLIWKWIGEPEHTSSRYYQFPTVDIETPYEEIIDAVETFDPEHFQKYPKSEHIKDRRFKNPARNLKYGNASGAELRDWYIVQHNRNPHPSVYHTSVSRNASSRPDSSAISLGQSRQSAGEKRVTSEVNYNTFSAKELKKIRESLDIKKTYEKLEYPDQCGWVMGYFLLNREWMNKKWDLTTTFPRIGYFGLNLSPIFIPSCGRPNTALLDLSPALQKTLYVQIVIVREEEKEKYLEYIQNYPEIDVFVMNRSVPSTVGAARSTAKKLAELITEDGKRSKFCFLMDDNVLCWQGVTLVNDPCPQFGVEPSDQRSQRTDVSLNNVLNYCSNQNIVDNKLDDFSIIGFSVGIGSHRSLNQIKLAFERQQVFVAVFLNIEKLKNIDYEEMAWAREDIDFNYKTNDNGGLIVKCRRFLAKKKFLDHGGVVPEDEGIFPLLKNNPEWKRKSYVKRAQGETIQSTDAVSSPEPEPIESEKDVLIEKLKKIIQIHAVEMDGLKRTLEENHNRIIMGLKIRMENLQESVGDLINQSYQSRSARKRPYTEANSEDGERGDKPAMRKGKQKEKEKRLKSDIETGEVLEEEDKGIETPDEDILDDDDEGKDNGEKQEYDEVNKIKQSLAFSALGPQEKRTLVNQSSADKRVIWSTKTKLRRNT